MRQVKAGISTCFALIMMVSCLLVQAADGIVAIVGDTVITHHDIDVLASALVVQGKLTPEQAQQSNSKKQLLDFAINRLLMKASAERYGIERPVSDTALIQALLTRYKYTPETLAKSLHNNGLTQAQFLHIFRDDMLIDTLQEQVVFAHATVTEKEISKYIQSYQDDNTYYHVVDFYLPKSDQKMTAQVFARKMQAALSAWKSGEEMPAGVIQQDLGLKRTDSLPEVFQRVIQGMASKTLSYMVITDNGYHAVYLAEKQVPNALNRQQARYALALPTADTVLSDWINELRTASYIRIMD